MTPESSLTAARAMTRAQYGDLEGLGAPSLCIAALRMSDIDYSAIIEGHAQWKLRLRK